MSKNEGAGTAPFDVARLKDLNRRIFQYVPSASGSNLKPGEFRPEIKGNVDWVKNRQLETVKRDSYVAYSRMDNAAHTRLSIALAAADPAKLSALKTEDFTKAIARLYTQVDYVHPFYDGNSRTLRAFTKQLAAASGYELNWDRFAKTPTGRDFLYIARDMGVNRIALKHISNDTTLINVQYTLESFESNRDLPSLLRDVVRPSRALAFDSLPRAEALTKHPELKEAYQTLDDAKTYFAAKFSGDLAERTRAVSGTLVAIVARLDSGETSGFRALSPALEKGILRDGKDRGFER